MVSIVENGKFKLVKLCLTALVLSAAILFSPNSAMGRWASSELAPIHIKRRDANIFVQADGTFKLTGTLELKVNTPLGRKLMAAFRFPLGDELEELKITSAEILEATKNRAIENAQIVLRDNDVAKTSTNPVLFRRDQSYVIPFGDLPVGTVTKITYEIQTKRSRVPGLFSKTFEWGREYPELTSSLTFESKEILYFDVSKAARSTLIFARGRQPDGNHVWKVDLKNPVFIRAENEQGGMISTATVPRLQISSKSSWSAIVDALAKNFTQESTDIFPRDFQKIVDEAKTITKLEDRLNRIIELLHQTVNYSREWSKNAGEYKPQRLSNLVLLKNQSKRGDAKDFAFATVAILRQLGYDADVALVWKQSPTEKVWIDETPTAPSLDLFNHVIVRLNDDGRIRYFDPSNSVAFSEGFLSDVGGSWALTLQDKTGAKAILEKLPDEASIVSQIKINQTLDLRPDSSIVGSGTVKVEGPLAAELKQVYFGQGATQIEPYLRALFGLSVKGDSGSPMIRVNTQDRRGKNFDLSFSYLAQNSFALHGQHREFDLASPGLAGVPLLANGERGTDVILSRNLTFEIETKITGGEIADETNNSCLALTSFASMLRETRVGSGAFTISDHIQFKTNRISAGAMRTPMFKNELAAYTGCLMRTRTAVGPRPAFEKARLGLSPQEVSALKKPAATVTLQDLQTLEDISSPQLRPVISTKEWLAARDMLRKNSRSPEVLLEYANALLKTGRVSAFSGDIYLPEHVAEAAKLFSAAGVQKIKSAKFHRVHALMLLATNRLKEATVAVQNAIALEKGQAKDSLLAGQIYARLGDENRAEVWLKLATTQRASKSMKITAIQALADLRLRQRKFQDFISLYKQAIDELPTNAWTYYDFAKRLNEAKLWDLSIEQARKALSLMKFPEAEGLLANSLIRKAEGLYFAAPGIPAADPKILEQAEALAVECLKYNRSEILAYRIAGHVTFLKAVAGDYGSLIATQSYLAKAVELGSDDSWIQERLNVANQALETSRPMAQLWSTYLATKTRVPAAKSAPTADPMMMRFPVR